MSLLLILVGYFFLIFKHFYSLSLWPNGCTIMNLKIPCCALIMNKLKRAWNCFVKKNAARMSQCYACFLIKKVFIFFLNNQHIRVI